MRRISNSPFARQAYAQNLVVFLPTECLIVKFMYLNKYVNIFIRPEAQEACRLL